MATGSRIFLAHASEDKERVHRLYHKLKERGFRPWLNKEDLLPGQNWRIEIPKAIRACEFCIACLSEQSIQKQGYVQKEFRMAFDIYAEKPPESIYLIPLKFENCKVPDIQITQFGVNLRDIQWVDYWKPDGLKRLLEAIANGEKSRNTPPDPSTQEPAPLQSVFSKGINKTFVDEFGSADEKKPKPVLEQPWLQAKSEIYLALYKAVEIMLPPNGR